MDPARESDEKRPIALCSMIRWTCIVMDLRMQRKVITHELPRTLTKKEDPTVKKLRRITLHLKKITITNLGKIIFLRTATKNNEYVSQIMQQLIKAQP